MKATLQQQQGQAMTEYLILTALIGVACIAITQVLSSNLRRKMSEVSNAIAGDSSKVKGIKAGESYFKVYDMGDFSGAIQNNSEKD